MADHTLLADLSSVLELTGNVKTFLNNTRDRLKGANRRQFMAQFVQLLGRGGQLRAEHELGWDRKTIAKGMKEIASGITCVDDFSSRGKKPTEVHLPNLLTDIESIIAPICQTDPTFRTSDLYSPITPKEVCRRLIEDMGYCPDSLSTERTIRKKWIN